MFKNLVHDKFVFGEDNSLCAYLSGDRFTGVHTKHGQVSWLPRLRWVETTVTLLGSCCSSLCSGKACVHLLSQMPSHLFGGEQNEVLEEVMFPVHKTSKALSRVTCQHSSLPLLHILCFTLHLATDLQRRTLKPVGSFTLFLHKEQDSILQGKNREGELETLEKHRVWERR